MVYLSIEKTTQSDLPPSFETCINNLRGLLKLYSNIPVFDENTYVQGITSQIQQIIKDQIKHVLQTIAANHNQQSSVKIFNDIFIEEILGLEASFKKILLSWTPRTPDVLPSLQKRVAAYIELLDAFSDNFSNDLNLVNLKKSAKQLNEQIKGQISADELLVARISFIELL